MCDVLDTLLDRSRAIWEYIPCHIGLANKIPRGATFLNRTELPDAESSRATLLIYAIILAIAIGFIRISREHTLRRIVPF
jgi:hypothetical protein